MKFQTIAPCQGTRGFIGRRKYCFLGLQPDKSSDMPTCREKLISYYFLRFKQDAIVTRRACWKMPLFLLRGVGGKRGKNPFDPADTSPPGCFLCYLPPFLSLRFSPLLPLAHLSPRTPPQVLLVMKSGGQIKQTVVPFSPDDADDTKTRASRRR